MYIMKIANLLFILLFLIAAYLQLNDPDPVLWSSLYLSGAALCAFALFGESQKSLLWLALVIYLGYAIYLLFSTDGVLSWYNEHEAENIAQSMKVDKPWIEMTREFFGLLILSIAIFLNILFQKKTISQPENNPK